MCVVCVFKEVRIGACDISFKGTVSNELLIMVESFSLITRLGEVILLQSYKRKGSRTCLEQCKSKLQEKRGAASSWRV